MSLAISTLFILVTTLYCVHVVWQSVKTQIESGSTHIAKTKTIFSESKTMDHPVYCIKPIGEAPITQLRTCVIKK